MYQSPRNGKTAEVLDKIKAQGFKYSTQGAITVAVCDAVIPPPEEGTAGGGGRADRKITRQYKRGLISNDERYNQVIKTWDETTKKVSDALTENLDQYNPIFMMADSVRVVPSTRSVSWPVCAD